MSSYRRIPDVMHHELDFLPELLGPLRGAVHQATEQLLVVGNHVEIKFPPESRIWINNLMAYYVRFFCRL